MRQPAAPFVLALAMSILAACSPENDRAVVTETVVLQIEADDSFVWNGDRISEAELNRRFDTIGTQDHPPNIHLEPDRHANYAAVARVLAAAQRAHVVHIGFTGVERP